MSIYILPTAPNHTNLRKKSWPITMEDDILTQLDELLNDRLGVTPDTTPTLPPPVVKERAEAKIQEALRLSSQVDNLASIHLSAKHELLSEVELHVAILAFQDESKWDKLKSQIATRYKANGISAEPELVIDLCKSLIPVNLRSELLKILIARNSSAITASRHLSELFPDDTTLMCEKVDQMQTFLDVELSTMKVKEMALEEHFEQFRDNMIESTVHMEEAVKQMAIAKEITLGSLRGGMQVQINMAMDQSTTEEKTETAEDVNTQIENIQSRVIKGEITEEEGQILIMSLIEANIPQKPDETPKPPPKPQPPKEIPPLFRPIEPMQSKEQALMMAVAMTRADLNKWIKPITVGENHYSSDQVVVQNCNILSSIMLNFTHSKYMAGIDHALNEVKINFISFPMLAIQRDEESSPPKMTPEWMWVRLEIERYKNALTEDTKCIKKVLEFEFEEPELKEAQHNLRHWFQESQVEAVHVAKRLEITLEPEFLMTRIWSNVIKAYGELRSLFKKKRPATEEEANANPTKIPHTQSPM